MHFIYFHQDNEWDLYMFLVINAIKFRMVSMEDKISDFENEIFNKFKDFMTG